ncbi:MAG: multicopper oxidase domain-containing protein [Gammaproteobacteria bacterium]|nr:multicopper oxidase domain-containing protein [Gammaproteobacteria bacterium]
MKRIFKHYERQMGAILLTLGLLPWMPVQAAPGHDVRGITPRADATTGSTFDLYTSPFYITLPEGTSLYMWGFGDLNSGAQATHTEGAGYNLPQYPGPTMIVTEGEEVTINLTNYGVPDTIDAGGASPVDNPVSMVVAGHNVTSSEVTAPTVPGLMTTGAKFGGTVQYTFTAGKPGTYIYNSIDGPNPALHSEMGLLGTLIVRPADGSRSAYGAATDTDYDQEYLYLLSETDPEVHRQMERGHYNHFSNNDRFATIYFVNGRVYPDLVHFDYNPLYPHQPYAALSLSHPRDKVLVRNANAGLDSHPFHYHGENHRFIGRDGQMISSDGLIADLGRSDNTINSAPKQTVDAIWTWSGKNMGWDIYGTGPGYEHSCNDAGDGFDPVTQEFCADHGKELPIGLPGVAELTFGGYWSGSPYMGDSGSLPPGEGGLNPWGGYFFAWHSHAEKELTTDDIFPGGNLSVMVVVPSSVDIQ